MIRGILILPVTDCEAFNSAIFTHAPENGVNFIGISGLSPTASLPPTHGMASTMMDRSFFDWIAALVAADFPNGYWVEWDNIGNPQWPWVTWLPSLNLQQVSGDE